MIAKQIHAGDTFTWQGRTYHALIVQRPPGKVRVFTDETGWLEIDDDDKITKGA